MCSTSVLNPAASSGADALFGALSDVAERNFFAFADPCDPDGFAELAEGTTEWVLASVTFTAGANGVICCAVPAALARELYAAFTAGYPDEEPPVDCLADLLGEFANMVCGAWLTRLGGEAIFALGRPVVHETAGGWRPICVAPKGGTLQTLASVNGQPVAVVVAGHGV